MTQRRIPVLATVRTCPKCQGRGKFYQRQVDTTGSSGHVTIVRACTCRAGRAIPRCRGCGCLGLPETCNELTRAGYCPGCRRPAS